MTEASTQYPDPASEGDDDEASTRHEGKRNTGLLVGGIVCASVGGLALLVGGVMLAGASSDNRTSEKPGAAAKTGPEKATATKAPAAAKAAASAKTAAPTKKK